MRYSNEINDSSEEIQYDQNGQPIEYQDEIDYEYEMIEQGWKNHIRWGTWAPYI